MCHNWPRVQRTSRVTEWHMHRTFLPCRRVNCHFYPQSRSPAGPNGECQNQVPVESIAHRSLPVALCDSRLHCETIDVPLFISVFLSLSLFLCLPSCLLPFSLTPWRCSWSHCVHQNASDLTKLDVGLVFAQFRSPIVRSALERK